MSTDARAVEVEPQSAAQSASSGAKLVLLALAAGQFLMTLDSSVMNVSMATVAADVGTTITGIQSAITLYTLVMASLMIVGSKLGTILGSLRAFRLGLVIYGAGSLTTAIAPNLTILLFGWSLLEGIGAALILPAIVALVAGNFPPERRTAAYGLIAAGGAMAVAAGPIIGGAATTFFSWRWVFAGEVLVGIAILLFSRRIADAPVTQRAHIDLVGAVLSATGLGLSVFGVLRSSEWGWLRAKSDGPELLGLSPVIWLIAAGILLLWLFFQWEQRVIRKDGEPLIRPEVFKNAQLTGGLTMFGAQFFLQAGIFFVMPLFLSVVLGLSALETGLRVLPLSFALIAAAAGIPRFWPSASPRRIVRLGVFSILVGTVVLIAALDADASAEVVTLPLLFIGLGIGALASQLGAITVSALPNERSAEVGGLQNTATNLGASLGTALVGSVLFAILTATAVTGLQEDPDVPDDIKSEASVELTSGVPFISDEDLQALLETSDIPPNVQQEVFDTYANARLVALRGALMVVALIVAVALFFTSNIPARAVSSTQQPAGGSSGPDR